MRLPKLSYILLVVLSLSYSFVHAQQLPLFLNQEYSAYYDQALNNPEESIHTGFKPLIQSQAHLKYNWSNGTYTSNDSINAMDENPVKRSWLYRKLYTESLFIIHDTAEKFWATIDPLFNFQGADDRGDSARKTTLNTRGFIVQGGIGYKFSFTTSFYENQATFPYYVDNFIQATNVIPGQGRGKTLNSATGSSFYSNGYDFDIAESDLSFSPSKYFNFQLGQGKNFIGDGYRSLLLSDNSFDYPFFKMTSTFGKFQYTDMYCLLLDLSNDTISKAGVEGLFQRKAASFQYLSWDVTKRLEWGFFQGLIWQASNYVTNKQSYNLNYFDPVIGVNALRYGLGGSPNNVLIGSTLKYKVTRNILAYGQLVANDLGPAQSIQNKTGFQAGMKYYNHLGELLIEYNQVRPYTYMDNNADENYTNYNQALADPLGANFKELIASVNIHLAKHFALHLQVNYAIIGEDGSHTNNGNNLLLSDTIFTKNQTTAAMGQGVKGALNYADGHISYLMNPRTNMNVVMGLSYRELTESSISYKSPVTMLFYFGFRTSLSNIYYDF